MSSNMNEKTVAIYVYFNSDGILTEDTLYYLKSLKNYVNSIIFISNSHLSDEAINLIQRISDDVIVRENSGYDFGAWKDFILENKTKLVNLDRLILCNSSCYGFFSSLTPAFEKAKKNGWDFWGITGFELKNKYPFHIQSYFLAFEKAILGSKDFIEFWEKLPKSMDWNTARFQGELQLTIKFMKAGFKPGVMFSSNHIGNANSDPSIFYPQKLLMLGSPFLKKKVIKNNYSYFLRFSNCVPMDLAIQFISKKNPELFKLIQQELLLTTSQSTLRRALHQTFILNDSGESNPPKTNKRIALILHVYYDSLLEITSSFVLNLPSDSHIFLVSSNKELLKKYERHLQRKFKHIVSRIQDNRGRNEAAYFITCADVLDNYDYICFAHDKKTPSALYPVMGESFMDHCFRCILGSPVYITNVIHTFEKNPNIGMLYPPPPLFSQWTSLILRNPMGTNLASSLDLIKGLGKKCVFDNTPDAPFGSMFWIRRGGLKVLQEKKLRQIDLPAEPLPSDGTLLHALERTYPTIVQAAGYFSGWVLPSRYANIYIDNLVSQLKEYVIREQNVKDTLVDPTTISLKFLLKEKIKLRLKPYKYLYNLARLSFKVTKKIAGRIRR